MGDRMPLPGGASDHRHGNQSKCGGVRLGHDRRRRKCLAIPVFTLPGEKIAPVDRPFARGVPVARAGAGTDPEPCRPRPKIGRPDDAILVEIGSQGRHVQQDTVGLVVKKPPPPRQRGGASR